MNIIEMQYKRDTGNTTKQVFETSDEFREGQVIVDDDILDICGNTNGDIEIYNSEYINWLEEKHEKL